MIKKTKTLLVLVVVAGCLGLVTLDSPTIAQQSIRPKYKGCSRPVCYTSPCDEMFGSGQIRLYDGKQFRKPVDKLHIDKEDENEVHNLPKYKISSLEWHLPPGVVVVFYEETKYDDDWPGSQFTIWGNGAETDLKRHEIEDEISSWSWHYVGR